jgi:FtsP/CotA-like multicopper oxidase with cupredoxin domain
MLFSLEQAHSLTVSTWSVIPNSLKVEHWEVNLAVGGLNVNGIPYEHGTHQATFNTGSVVEWKLNPGNPTAAQRHPLHVHVWPFQIVSLPLQSAEHADNYYQVFSLY